MDKDIKAFIKEICDKTGVHFSVYNKDGEFIDGDSSFDGQVPKDINDIVLDGKTAQTFFPIKYKGKNLIGRISGCDKIQQNYAFLISELVENLYFKESGLTKSEFYKAVLFGELSHSQIYKYMHKFSIPELSVFVMLVGAEGKQIEEIKNILVNGCEELDFVVDIDKNQLAFIKFVSDTTNEYQSPIEYAEFIKQMVYEETGINIKIAIGSTVNSIVQASISFSHAVWAFRMQSALGTKGDIHSFKEYVLIKMLEDLPKYKLGENLETLMDSGAKEIFNDEEMINTAEEFLENNLNTSETSRKLYLHRNTLIYRLDKIERATGLNIRKFSDAVTFRLITILSRLVK